MNAMTGTTCRLLAISGSLRRDSYNTAVLRSLVDLVGDKADIRLFALNDIPLYCADLDGDHPPQAVRDFKAAIAESDGLVICSPEYNFGIPGVLKNALDWASRPASHSPLKGKPVLIMSASTGALGGARSHYQIRETLTSTRSRVVCRPAVTITHVKDKVTGGRLTDQATIAFALDAVSDLFREIEVARAFASLAARRLDPATI